MATKVDFVEVGRRAHELANRHRRNAYQYVARLAAQALERLMRPIFGRLLGRPTISLSPNLEELHLRCEEKERMTEFEALERIGLVCPKRCQYFRRSFLVAWRSGSSFRSIR